MSGRRVHLPPERIGASRAELTEEARHYLRDVLRLGPGDAVELFDGQGRAWAATLEPGLAVLSLGEPRAVAASGPLLSLLFALSKGEKSDLVVQKATELGVARLVPWAAERSVVKLDGSKGQERAARWRRIAEEAARQCGRADVPEVRAPSPLDAALASVPPDHARVVLHAAGAAPLQGLGLAGAPGLALVVGPEGGLTEAELETCAAAGARRGSLGPRVLRAETAAIVALALAQGFYGDLA